MSLIKINIKSINELKELITSHRPAFYFSSQTSTVIPYDKLEVIYKNDDFTMVDLSQLPATQELTADNNLLIKGPVSWKDAKDFLRSKNRYIMTSPTEELALITAGAATSATGERCFHFGSLRTQINKIKYIDYSGIEQELSSDKPFKSAGVPESVLSAYQEEFKPYQEFKNAPFPRLESETDLMIGSEGQLGVITEIEIKTTKDPSLQHFFMLLPKWEESTDAHIEVMEKIQAFRDQVYLCEFIDSNSFNFLPIEERPNNSKDALFFELNTEFFETFYEEFLLKLSFLNEEEVFELSETKFHQLRASIPRAVYEENSKMGVTKLGTDVQVKVQDFKALMEIYTEFTKSEPKVSYNLFGHFGDAHLHFNFLPKQDQMQECQERLEFLYSEVKRLAGSPFAEHGIGMIKQKYIKTFWTKEVTDLFLLLKKQHDPYNQFFPQGYMNLK